MKLVGDSKFIAEAYQKIYEDDFMSGMNEYEKRAKNQIFVADTLGFGGHITEHDLISFKAWLKNERNLTIEQALGMSIPEALSSLKNGKVIMGYSLLASKSEEKIKKADMIIHGQGDDIEENQWMEDNVDYSGLKKINALVDAQIAEMRKNPDVFITSVHNSRGVAGVFSITGPVKFITAGRDAVKDSEEYTGVDMQANVIASINSGRTITLEGEEGPIFIGPTFKSVEDTVNEWIDGESTGDDDDITWDDDDDL